MKRKPLQRRGKPPLVQNWLKLFALPCVASGRPVIAAERMTHLFTETLRAGESMDAFVLRLAPKLNQLTAELRAEVSGIIRTVAGRHAVDARTYHDRYSCLAERDRLPYVHTHPNIGKGGWRFSLGTGNG